MTEPRDLIFAYLDGLLNEQQTQELDAWLRKDPAHAKEFVRLAKTSWRVREHLQQEEQVFTEQLSDEAFSDLLAQLDADEDHPAQLVDLTDQLKKQRREAKRAKADRRRNTTRPMTHNSLVIPKWVVYGSIAAVLAIAAVILWPAAQEPAGPSVVDHNNTQQHEPDPVLPVRVATLTGESNARWARRPSSELFAGERYTLMAGFAEITTEQGAVAILQAPASIELLDHPNAIQLNQGKLVGLCHTERSKGFLVKTDYADITDLGTEFAVEARPDGVDTTVFVGAVEVTTPDGGVQPLTASQTARLTLTNGTRDLRIEETRSNDFTRRLPRQPVILSATTNNTAYRAQVVPLGVYEDAKAYLNRDYELNGVNADGIPTVLFDGDRVLMDAHEDQIKRLEPDDPDLHLEIMLGAPADLYVLMNKQSGVPGWLKRDYEDTGLEVGLDESEDKRTSPLAIGPGKGIDATLRVWKMKTVADKKVTLDYGRVESVFIVIAVPTQGGGGAADP